MTAYINLNEVPLTMWTRPALIAEVKRLRDHMALYLEIEQERAAEAAKRQAPVVVIEPAPPSASELNIVGFSVDLIRHVSEYFAVKPFPMPRAWSPEVPAMVQAHAEIDAADQPYVYTEEDFITSDMDLFPPAGLIGDPHDFLLPGEMSVAQVHAAYRKHDAAKAAGKAVHDDTV